MTFKTTHHGSLPNKHLPDPMTIIPQMEVTPQRILVTGYIHGKYGRMTQDATALALSRYAMEHPETECIYQWLSRGAVSSDHTTLYGDSMHRVEGVYVTDAPVDAASLEEYRCEVGVNESGAFRVVDSGQKRGLILSDRGMDYGCQAKYLEDPSADIQVLTEAALEHLVEVHIVYRNKPKPVWKPRTPTPSTPTPSGKSDISTPDAKQKLTITTTPNTPSGSSRLRHPPKFVSPVSSRVPRVPSKTPTGLSALVVVPVGIVVLTAAVGVLRAFRRVKKAHK
ncbi:hypothetical protein KIPB_005826 [Kipferlia bialata]|uniref:Uncharacterized protein n=1 Tax=Kipferlia bialata TaxID=797122 RepID=A0A9K3CXK8_9EUKA|nr:hypothetical protein KIPB_005826 [Kipferlia bialata]|eukprot:g5826.t1